MTGAAMVTPLAVFALAVNSRRAGWMPSLAAERDHRSAGVDHELHHAAVDAHIDDEVTAAVALQGHGAARIGHYGLGRRLDRRHRRRRLAGLIPLVELLRGVHAGRRDKAENNEDRPHLLNPSGPASQHAHRKLVANGRSRTWRFVSAVSEMLLQSCQLE